MGHHPTSDTPHQRLYDLERPQAYQMAFERLLRDLKQSSGSSQQGWASFCMKVERLHEGWASLETPCSFRPKMPNTETYEAWKKRRELPQPIGEPRKNIIFLLEYTFSSLNLQAYAQPWRQNSLNLAAKYQSWGKPAYFKMGAFPNFGVNFRTFMLKFSEPSYKLPHYIHQSSDN